jgi:hypothetical protein
MRNNRDGELVTPKRRYLLPFVLFASFVVKSSTVLDMTLGAC